MALASRGQRDMDGGPEAIVESEELARVRRQARKVHAKALVLAAALMTLTLIIPF